MEKKSIAILTGASSGMGKDFALQIDASETFDEIWLIARRADRLETLASALRSKAVILPLDLSLPESVGVLKKKLEEEKPFVKVAVNASGFGRFGAFETIPLETEMQMVDLNSRWTVAFTGLILPYLDKGSEVYLMGSMSSFQPVPYIAVYGASKAFVLSFSRAVGREVKPRGIRIMAVCPLWIKTEFFDHAVTDDTIVYYSRYYESADVVRKALKDMKKGKDVSVLGKYANFQRFLVKILPHPFVMNTWCKQQKKP